MKTKMTEAEKAARREARKMEKKEVKELAIIANHKAQKPVASMTITIEWTKSRTWGNNPRATANIRYKDGSFGQVGPFTCSGCGYDKESTVIADVFNEALRFKLYQKYSGQAPYGIYYYNGDAPKKSYLDRNDKLQTYYETPSYNGGVGTSCYYAIAAFVGGEFKSVASGKTFDVYEYTDKN